MEKSNIHIFALAALGTGLSGSDRIFIEFARRWSKNSRVKIYVWTEGYEMCQRQDLISSDVDFKVSSMKPWKSFGFVINYFALILEGARLGLTLELKDGKETILYNASDFWMDFLPCFILKLRFPQVKWVASWYQTAPNPFKGFSEGARKRKYKFNALFYWLSQFPVKPIITNFADFVLVNNEEERKQFSKLNTDGKVKVVLGAVDIRKINKWITKIGQVPKVYDAVFQGRFHPQKGAVELVEIWGKVVTKKPNAKLAMLGDGPLMSEVKTKIKSLKLESNIQLFGYLFDGEEKYRIFSQSRIVVHPAFYDSGGMAAGEAMAFGLPGIGFDLKSYDSYYPKGMLKVKIGDLKAFAEAILKLLSNSKLMMSVGSEAATMIKRNWSWDERAKEVFDYVKN